MVDAQEFEGLSFSRDRFAPELLQELQETASNTVTITDDEVIIKHLYTERRLYPLDLYIKEMSLEKAKEAVIDYGHAIVDLATANIFPGDLFIKNFGVTPCHGGVVFYDYDELCLLAHCNFRIMPEARPHLRGRIVRPALVCGGRERHLSGGVPGKFLWVPAPLRQVMEAHHSQLFTVEFWRGLQERTGAGEILDFFPYDQERRFARKQCIHRLHRLHG